MKRKEVRKQIIHTPSTHEIFCCLCTMPIYSELLLKEKPREAYSEFLRWLINNIYHKERNRKTTIKSIALEFNSNTNTTTKWLRTIYDGIFQLNNDKPELFIQSGNYVWLYMHHNDNRCSFATSLMIMPREHETIKFPFVKAKIGIDWFWVKKVEHTISYNEPTVDVWLEGGPLNKYREFILEKGLFQGWIHFTDVFNKTSYELDEKLRKLDGR